MCPMVTINKFMAQPTATPAPDSVVEYRPESHGPDSRLCCARILMDEEAAGWWCS
ncbi:hypothetical protein I79_021193 [Cricetulus griseus]|uniref:Uncharacterized protein n=1 Tax=Cricetulus griseus TaxID=10029 RepID=G3IC06_CRIGR|nr:hypothetical protein I79_021193 [Cricetulus griseus]